MVHFHVSSEECTIPRTRTLSLAGTPHASLFARSTCPCRSPERKGQHRWRLVTCTRKKARRGHEAPGTEHDPGALRSQAATASWKVGGPPEHRDIELWAFNLPLNRSHWTPQIGRHMKTLGVEFLLPVSAQSAKGLAPFMVMFDLNPEIKERPKRP